MKDGQEAIYYVTGASREAAENSPHLEAFRAKGYEVLFSPTRSTRCGSACRRSSTARRSRRSPRAQVDLDTDEEKKQAEAEREETSERFKDLLLGLRAALQDEVKEVRLSARLTTSPACLVGDADDLTPHAGEDVPAMGQEVPKVKRILELNPTHPLVTGLQAFHAAHPADERFARYAELLYGQAMLAEGGDLTDPAAFSQRLAELLVEATGA